MVPVYQKVNITRLITVSFHHNSNKIINVIKESYHMDTMFG